jgi:hypothetical protein
MPSSYKQYFATLPADELSGELIMTAKASYNAIESTGYREKLRDIYAAYHGFYYTSDGHRISFTGEQGELVNLPVNHLRNFGQHMLIMTTSNRPAMEARATNSDYKSKVQTLLCNNILDYYMREKRLERYLKDAVELAICLGAGYIKVSWNASSGEVIDHIEETNTDIHEGDLEFTNLTPFDVIFDNTKENTAQDWVMVRTWKNKFDLAAKYPELSEKIMALSTKSEMQAYRFNFNAFADKTDDVPVYEFFHKRSESLPDGRYFMFLDEHIVLHDLPMPYRMLPLFRISPSNILGTPLGYTPLFDLYPLQEALNSLYSTVMTNQNAFGVQNVWVPPGGNINVSAMGGGLNVIESLVKPEPINLTSTPPEIFQYIQMLEKTMEVLSGVNSVARGNPESSLKTGAALALVQSMALQFMSGLQASYVQLIEDVGTAVVKILQDFAETKRLVAIAGKTGRTYMKEFSSRDISNISRVVVDVANPLAHTTAGRVQMADNLLQYQLIKNPQQYLTLLNTGRLDAMTEDSQRELFNIQAENETMLDGETPMAVLTDDHWQHILEHRSVLADPDLRKDPELIQRVTDHLSQHFDILRTTDPAILQALGQQPLPPPQQQMPPAPEQGGPNPSDVNDNMEEMMTPPMEGQMGVGPDQQNERVRGPGLAPEGNMLPNIPSVPDQLIPNPNVQPPGGRR